MKTVRGRVFAALATTALVCTVLTVAVATAVLTHQQHDRRLAAIARTADALAPALATSGARTRVFRLAQAGGEARPLRAAAQATVLSHIPAGDGEGFADGVRANRIAYASRTIGGQRIVIIGPSREKAVSGPPPGRTVLLAGAGGLLVALLVGGLFTFRLTRPVREVTAAAERVAAGDTDVRVPESGALEYQHLGRAFNAMTTDLRAARDAEKRFLASVSHELKTPLTSLRGYAEAIEDGTVAPGDGAATISREAVRLERLVADLLDLARLQQASFAIAREPIDLGAVAVAAVERHTLRARELGVELALDDGGDAHGIGDADRALQAVSNLIENALRVAAAGGRVTVAARPGLIEVRDDGPGLAPEDLPHAFERFYLHDKLASRRPVGSGLGLAIVAELAAGMGGEATVDSRPGGPTAFALRLRVRA